MYTLYICILELQETSRYNFTLNYSSYITQQQLESMLKKINQSINQYTNTSITDKIIYKKYPSNIRTQISILIKQI